ncbi:MAG: hypothetical protein Q4C41_04885 [Eggerthellaceae bacterium]|nr:hypothetical protein [Eggerthellaceae bacterium]
MRKRSWARTGVVAVLTVSLSVACVPQVLALASDEAAEAAAAREAEAAAAEPPESTAQFEKAEVVYAALDAHGAPQAAYVVNRFEVDEAGEAVDFGAYDDVLNMTDTSALDYNEAGQFTTFHAEPGTFSYQGTMDDVVLPWIVDITYELDGQSVSPDELAGASGALCVHVTTQRNDAFAAASSFYDSFMLQITFTLPGEACAHVAADGATVAVSGSDRTVAFTVLPGADGDFTLTADVSNFYMDGATIAALPYSSVVDMPDTSSVAGGMQSLSDAVSQLASGANALAAGASELAGASSQINAGLAQMENMIPPELEEALGALEGIDVNPDQIAEIGGYLDTLIGQLEDLKGVVEENEGDAEQAVDALVQQNEQLRQLLSAIEGALGGAGADMPTDAEIASLRAFAAGDADQAATVEALVSAAEDAQRLRALADQIEAALGSIGVPSLGEGDTAAALDDMISSLKEARDLLSASGDLSGVGDLASLADGLSQLKGFAAQYGQFDSGLATYASGVSAYANGVAQLNAATSALPEEMQAQIDEMMASYDFPAFDGTSFAAPGKQTVAEVQFVMTTAAIEAPDVEEEAEEEEELTILDRFFALFG